jgi:hypothetical protein
VSFCVLQEFGIKFIIVIEKYDQVGRALSYYRIARCRVAPVYVMGESFDAEPLGRPQGEVCHERLDVLPSIIYDNDAVRRSGLSRHRS